MTDNHRAVADALVEIAAATSLPVDPATVNVVMQAAAAQAVLAVEARLAQMVEQQRHMAVITAYALHEHTGAPHEEALRVAYHQALAAITAPTS